jgi:hypothetical protein
MNKKFLMFGILGFFAIALVSAVLIDYYGLFNQEVNVNQPIEVTGDTTQSIDCEAGDSCDGSEIRIGNDGTQEIAVSIVNIADEGVNTIYKSNLELTKKSVDFTKDVWDILNDKVQIEYTIVGDNFNAKVTEGAKEGYELIYYKDNSNRFNSPAKAIKLSDVSENLPYEDDKNAEEYDYCSTNEYATCHGAKIWYVPSNAINSDGSLDWSRASEFYFESELIQFNSEGNVITYPTNTISILPVYEFDLAIEEGTYTITTLVNPVI